MKELGMSWRSRRRCWGGGEYEREINPISLGAGAGGPPPENFQKFRTFSSNLGTPRLYCEDRTFPLIEAKFNFTN